MQNSFKEDFDLQVRSIMEDAQEPAPAGAWRAISSRLDALAGAPVAAAPRVWYWAGAALAMAAAIVLGIFFTGTSDKNSNLININSAQTLVSQEVAPVSPVAKLQARTLRPVWHEGSAVPAAESAELNEELNEEPACQAAGIESTETTDVPVAKEEPVKKTADPFAQMAFEDARSSHRPVNVSVTLIGGTSGNNASSGRVTLAAPGSYAQNGIVETSQSTYGIPVIVGVGARIGLTDAISIGTGLDYALLSRTFRGSYTDGSGSQSGDFNHTLQYIGIPVDLFVTLIERKDIKLYSNVGGEVEKAVSNKYHLLGTDTIVGDKVRGVQWSVGGGLGIEFSVGKRTAIFAEPTFKYYFSCDQPKSVRTDKPFQMVLRAGLRFDIK